MRLSPLHVRGSRDEGDRISKAETKVTTLCTAGTAQAVVQGRETDDAPSPLSSRRMMKTQYLEGTQLCWLRAHNAYTHSVQVCTSGTECHLLDSTDSESQTSLRFSVVALPLQNESGTILGGETAAYLAITMSVMLPAGRPQRGHVSRESVKHNLLPAFAVCHLFTTSFRTKRESVGAKGAQKIRHVAPRTSSFDGLFEKVELNTAARRTPCE